MSDDVTLPILPLKHAVLLPFTTMPLSVGRASSVAAVEAALATEDKLIAVFTQRDPAIEEPERDQLVERGVVGVIQRMGRTREGLKLLVQGLHRVEIADMEQTTPYLKAKLRKSEIQVEQGTEVEALTRQVISQLSRAQELVEPEGQIDLQAIISELPDPVQRAYLLGAVSSLKPEQSLRLLEAGSNLDVLKLLNEFLVQELQVLELQEQIAKRTGSEIKKEQRDYLLRQQMRTIQEELGDRSPEEAEVVELRKRFEEATLPDNVRQEAEKELTRLERMSSNAPDFQLTRAHLDLILELPWTAETTDNFDLTGARSILDEDHFGLEDVKDRIIEHLAVMKLNPKAHSPILCLVGPPGVGKTSLGQSIGRALGRKFERMSLGGLHDEAELRGHRRTYIGAMPGRPLQAIRRAGVRNPLLMLDEIDKLGRDYRGDPAAALMEILDPSQNSDFRDNYLDLPFDLSRVFFIATANAIDTIPGPLLDRLEVLRLSGYTEEEKLEIATRYLFPRQRDDAGLSPEQLTVDKETLQALIQRYTREAGVRELERMLGRLARKIAAQVASGVSRDPAIRRDELPVLLGPERFFQEQARAALSPGVATGMAWTEAGGDVLYIEAVLIPGGRRGLKLTGQLGKVMKESARAAYSYVLSHAPELGISTGDSDVHVHVPAGAIPKDGPSAGVAMTVALASLFTGHPVNATTAMTGEMTLSGLVLPVGGIKEKVLAARRAGIRKIILPKANEHDLAKLPEAARQELEIVLVERIDEALRAAIPSLPAVGDAIGRRASTSAANSRSRESQVASKTLGREES